MKIFSNTKYIKVIIIAVVLVVAGIVALVLQLREQGYDSGESSQMQVYFFSPAEGRLYWEERPWPEGSTLDLILMAMGHLQRLPQNNNLTTTWPTTIYDAEEELPFLLWVDFADSMAVIDFGEVYFEMSPVQEALFRSALTLTLVGLPYVDEVMIRVNGREWIESTETIANAPEISYARLANIQITLYLIDESGEGLVREYYSVTEADIQQRERTALEHLISSAYSIIPEETRVRVIPADETLTSVYVNLSSEFSTNFTGSSAAAQLMIASIVNTVLENSPPAVRQVFFLIDSARQESFHGVPYFDRGFEYDETVMVGFVAAIPEDDKDEGAAS